jgi:hypothetical protein
MAMATLERNAANSGIKVIDADTHITEPHDLWLKRAPASIRDRVPQVRMLNGERCWVIDGDKSIGHKAHPSSAIRKDGSKVRVLKDFLELEFEDVHAGSSSIRERLEVMDATGIYAQIVYPNILGFGGQAAAKVEPALRLVGRQGGGQGDRALRGDGAARDQHPLRPAHGEGRRRQQPARSRLAALGPAVGGVRGAQPAGQLPHRRERAVDRLDGAAGLALATA